MNVPVCGHKLMRSEIDIVDAFSRAIAYVIPLMSRPPRFNSGQDPWAKDGLKCSACTPTGLVMMTRITDRFALAAWLHCRGLYVPGSVSRSNLSHIPESLNKQTNVRVKGLVTDDLDN